MSYSEVFASLSTATETTGSRTLDTLLPYLNLGLITVLVLLFVTKTGIVPKWSLDDSDKRHRNEMADKDAAHSRELALKDAQIAALQNDKDELRRTNEQLTRVAQEQFLPALIEANRLTALYVDTIARRQAGSRGTSGGSRT